MTVIITDSTCDFSLEEAAALKIEMLPLQVNFEDGSYRDKFEMTPEEFYQKMRTSESLPTTSLLSVGAFKEAFDAHKDEEILVITISSVLSGTNLSAQIAKEQTGRSDIYILDTETVSIVEGLVVEEAVRLRDAGKNAEQIIEELTPIIPRMRAIAVLDTLKNLIKGGRLSSAQGLIGSALLIKPLVSVNQGKVESLAKARGSKAALRKAVELAIQDGALESPWIKYGHANNPDAAAALQAALGRPGKTSWIGSVIGAHAGEGAYGVAYLAKETE